MTDDGLDVTPPNCMHGRKQKLAALAGNRTRGGSKWVLWQRSRLPLPHQCVKNYCRIYYTLQGRPTWQPRSNPVPWDNSLARRCPIRKNGMLIDAAVSADLTVI